MIAEARQQELHDYVRAKQLEWRQVAFAGQWDRESLAADIAADADFVKVRLCGWWYGPTQAEIQAVLAPVLALEGFGLDLAMVSDVVALACHKRRVQSNPLVALVDFAAAAWARANS